MTKISILVEIIFTGNIELEINYWQLITLNELATVKVNATIRDSIFFWYSCKFSCIKKK